MDSMIIGIHGLANKPRAETLEHDWKLAMLEGLEKNFGKTIATDDFNFEMVYWADVGREEGPEARAYRPAEPDTLRQYKDTWRDLAVAGALDLGGDVLDALKEHFGLGKFADAMLARAIRDLSRYYENAGYREELRNRLSDRILAHRDKHLTIISHSMGTVIAYDVLRALGQEDSSLKVAHFITLGSPLGLPHVRNKIEEENEIVRTPTIVEQWWNFADRRDPVALDTHLRGDYGANDRGVRVVDDLVANDWDPPHHKSYGYLRAPEVSAVIARVISSVSGGV